MGVGTRAVVQARVRVASSVVARWGGRSGASIMLSILSRASQSAGVLASKRTAPRRAVLGTRILAGGRGGGGALLIGDALGVVASMHGIEVLAREHQVCALADSQQLGARLVQREHGGVAGAAQCDDEQVVRLARHKVPIGVRLAALMTHDVARDNPTDEWRHHAVLTAMRVRARTPRQTSGGTLDAWGHAWTPERRCRQRTCSTRSW